MLFSFTQACYNPSLKKEGGITINPFGGWLSIDGTKYDGLEIEYNLGIKNVNDQGLIVSLQPSSKIKDYISSEPIFVEANSIKNMTLKIWVGGKSEYDTVNINYVCADGTPQFLETYFNLEIIGKGISPPPSSSCSSIGLDGCYAGVYRDYYCSSGQLQYKATCTRACCQLFGGVMAFCSSDNSQCISPDPNEKLDIEILTPENKTSGDRKISMNVSTSNMAKYIYYALNSNRFTKGCQYCHSYTKQFYVTEGSNQLIIRTEDYFGNYSEETVIFTVDSIVPRIKKIEPNNGQYIKGSNFTVYYDENSVKNVTLYYGKEGSMNEYFMNYCSSGQNQACSAEVDVSSYDGQEIQYYFVVSDEIHSSISKVNRVYVDKTVPLIKVNSPSTMIYNGKAPIDVNISELVMSLEMSDNDGRPKRLCRNCDYYSRNTSFSEGTHKLTLKAIDNAGNEGYGTITFNIDSKRPRIKKIEPNNGQYIKGSNFTVYYDEYSVKNVSLFYGKEGSMNEYFMNYCPSGQNQACSAIVDLTKYDGEAIQYYFVVRSDLYEEKSDTYGVNVDNTVPTVTIKSPLNTTYNSRTVRLNVSASENGQLEMSDNGGRFIRLCSNCKSYDHSYYFNYGTHNLTIRATDNAGNAGYASIIFTIET